jgi:hypothetical protein
MIRLLVHAQNAEFKAKHGVFLPNVAKLNPTVKALREEYEIPARRPGPRRASSSATCTPR